MRISRGLPFNACVNARECTSGRAVFNKPTNLTNNHELHQGVAPPGLTYLTYRWRVKQGEDKNKAQAKSSLCIGGYVLISVTKREVGAVRAVVTAAPHCTAGQDR